MATPNIVSVATINGFVVNGAVTTSNQDVVDVAADYVYKINNIIIANIDGTNAATVTVSVSTDNGSNYHAIASTVNVPADATLMVIDKSKAFYLDETDLLRIVGSANGDLTYLVSGEKITDQQETNMAHFAELDSNNIVLRVIVISNTDVDANGGDLSVGAESFTGSLVGFSENGAAWKQTSYNNNFRTRYAILGGKYDPINNEFLKPDVGE